MGIGGATCAQAVAQGGALLIYCVYLILKNHGIQYRPYINPAYIKKLCLLGFPESSFILSLSLLEAGVNALALNAYSVQGVAVVALSFNLFMIVAYVSEGISEYETVATNWALGEKSREEIRYGMRVTFRAVLMEGLAFSLLFLLAAPQIVGLFGIDDPDTARNAAAATRILAVAPIAIITARVTAIFHQYTEKIGRAIVIILLSFGLVSLALAALLGHIGLEYLIAGIALGPVATIAFLWLFPSAGGKRAAIDLHRMTVVFGDEYE